MSMPSTAFLRLNGLLTNIKLKQIKGIIDDPKYILNLLLSVITVSMKTIDLVGQLPKFEVVNNYNQSNRGEPYPIGNVGDLPMVAEKRYENK